jgi:bifunctional enzyme CysN/CysC
MTEQKQRKLVIVGHVDHGKSTLLGRLLMDFGKFPKEKVEKVSHTCLSKGMQLEPAFLLDALQEEQEQGISIDTTRVNFEFEERRFLLIDAPGHLEFLKNMTSGASGADTGILVVDGHDGICSQTLRHLKILSILGVANVIVVVNKMDKTGYSQARFEKVAAEIRTYVEKEQNCLSVIPISALKGENLSHSVKELDWYKGLPLMPQLCAHTDAQIASGDDAKSTGVAGSFDEPFRMIVQDVYRFTDERYFAGRVVGGRVRVGDKVFFSPSGKVSTVEAIESFPAAHNDMAVKGDSVALRLSDQIFVERGEIISSPEETPQVNTAIEARLVWLNSAPLDWTQEYLLKLGTAEVSCRLEPGADGPAVKTVNGDFLDVTIKTKTPVSFDYNNDGVNKLVICTTFETVACGAVKALSASSASPAMSKSKRNNTVVESGFIRRNEFEKRQGHNGAVLWMTGLSGAGKSSLAGALERRLFDDGYRVVVLDGDNLRNGICEDLGFHPDDRTENIRRVAHLAKLFLDTGAIVITACISPYEKDRRMAEQIIGKDDFNELFVFCPMEICKSRDPKGLYKKASSGQIEDLSGVNAPYQPPSNPALRLDTSEVGIEAEVDLVVDLMHARGIRPPGQSEFSVFDKNSELGRARISPHAVSRKVLG